MDIFLLTTSFIILLFLLITYSFNQNSQKIVSLPQTILFLSHMTIVLLCSTR